MAAFCPGMSAFESLPASRTVFAEDPVTGARIGARSARLRGRSGGDGPSAFNRVLRRARIKKFTAGTGVYRGVGFDNPANSARAGGYVAVSCPWGNPVGATVPPPDGPNGEADVAGGGGRVGNDHAVLAEGRAPISVVLGIGWKHHDPAKASALTRLRGARAVTPSGSAGFGILSGIGGSAATFGDSAIHAV